MFKNNYLKIIFFIALISLGVTIASANDENLYDCKVVLKVEFLKTSKIGKIELFSTTCEKKQGFEKKAIEAAKKIKFSPKKENGKKVTIVKKVNFDFKIKDHENDTDNMVSVKQGVVILDKPRAGYPKSTVGTICVTGVVRLKVVFLSNGKIGGISLVKGLPRGFSNKAIEAAKKMKFIPMKRDKIPISISKVVNYNFGIY